MKRKFMAEDIASDLDAPEGASVPLPKAPFSDADLERIYAACDAIGAPRNRGRGIATGAEKMLRTSSSIFRCGVTFSMRQLTEIWRGKRLSKVFELAEPFEEKPTPHRFRHTFVRILLDTGVPVAVLCDAGRGARRRSCYGKLLTVRGGQIVRDTSRAQTTGRTRRTIRGGATYPINRGGRY